MRKKLFLILVIFQVLSACSLTGSKTQQNSTPPPGTKPSLISTTPKPAAGIPPDGAYDHEASPYRIYVEKGSFTINIYSKGEGQEYTVPVKSFHTAIGSTSEETKAGVYVLGEKERWHKSTSGKYVQYASFFGNDLSICSSFYETDDINSLLRESYNRIGTRSTNGSLFTTVEAARWIFENCPAGTVVEIVDGSPRNTTSAKPPDLDPDYFFTDPTDPLGPSILPPSDLPYQVYIEKGSFTITIYAKDSDGNYTKPVKSYRTAVGKTAGRTPVGTFKIGKKERWHAFAYPFEGGYAQYACTFYKNLMIHSPVYGMKNIRYLIYDLYYEIGKMATAGCLRTTTDAAYWIYTYCPEGTPVKIVNGSPRGTTSAEPPKIDPAFKGMDPTDPFKPLPKETPSPTPEASLPAPSSASGTVPVFAPLTLPPAGTVSLSGGFLSQS